jgi:hypothetical protein
MYHKRFVIYSGMILFINLFLVLLIPLIFLIMLPMLHVKIGNLGNNEVYYAPCEALKVDEDGEMYLDPFYTATEEPPYTDNYLQIGRNNVGDFYVLLHGNYKWSKSDRFYRDSSCRVKEFRNSTEPYRNKQ